MPAGPNVGTVQWFLNTKPSLILKVKILFERTLTIIWETLHFKLYFTMMHFDNITSSHNLATILIFCLINNAEIGL